RKDYSASFHKMKSSLIQCRMERVHLLYLGGAKGGAIVGLYQNDGYDEQRNEHIDTSRYACSGVEG
ncbi:MAG: hypothetical protein MR436_12390, partial [Eubacterium sp.]|nr:hypothetical protein [Eubacterium sp.]